MPSLLLLLFACSDNSVKTTNSTPEILITSHADGSSFTEGEIVEFRAQVSDGDESVSNLRTTWYINNTLACDWLNAQSDGSASCTIALPLGATQINTTVKDSQDSAAMDSLTIQVWPIETDTDSEDTDIPDDNDAPVVFITTPESGDIFEEGQSITLSGLVQDDSDPAESLTIEWSADSVGTIDISNATPDGNLSTQTVLDVGQHTISLNVTDSNGASTEKSVSVEVQAIELPLVECRILTPNDGDTIVIGNSGNLFEMEGFIGSSGDLANLSYNFASNLDGWLTSGSINTDGSIGWTSSGTSLTEATHTFSLDVMFNGQSICSDSLQVTIEQPILSVVDKKVFVSSQRHTGDFGGISGADSFCQGLAAAAGLQGTYYAWLSDSTTSPAARFAYASVPYKLVDGTTIANDWNDLTDGSIQHPINLDEYGNPAATNLIYSFTRIDGTPGLFTNPSHNCYGGDCHCNNWTNDQQLGSPTPGSAMAQSSQSNDDWTDYSFVNACGPTGYPIYCFQQ